MKKKIVVILMTCMMICSTGACSNGDASSIPKDNTTQEEQKENTSKPTDEEDSVTISDFMTCPEFSAEKNTSSMIDEISLTAKANAASLTDEQAVEIINAIKAADHKFYNGPEEMEKYMWYGYLLDYKYDDSDPRSELGADLCQAIKYVYRNAETVLDDATQENLQQIDKDLENIQ